MDKPLDLKKLGHCIRFLRQGRGWSLADLANTSRVSKAYISDVENGVAGKPNIQYIFSIATALGVTINDLLSDEVHKVSKTTDKPRKSEIPIPLLELQRELDLTDEDVETLAQVNFRGNRPRNKEGWRFILEAIKMSSRAKTE